jgi:hypothetical protein
MDDSDLKTAFDATFIASCDRRSWKTARGRCHWLESEGWTDAIAGPLRSILKDGGCEYVYPRQDSFFLGVHDPNSLRNRLLEWHAKLASNCGNFAPVSDDERLDQNFMESLLANIQIVIERAIELESRRWQAIRKPAG